MFASPFHGFYKLIRDCWVVEWHLDMQTAQTHFVQKFGYQYPNVFQVIRYFGTISKLHFDKYSLIGFGIGQLHLGASIYGKPSSSPLPPYLVFIPLSFPGRGQSSRTAVISPRGSRAQSYDPPLMYIPQMQKNPISPTPLDVHTYPYMPVIKCDLKFLEGSILDSRRLGVLR